MLHDIRLRRSVSRRFARVLAVGTLCSAFGAMAPACELKLLLTWDVSASMTAHEYHLQRHGTARAFLDPGVGNAISMMPGGIVVSILQWGGPDEQSVSLPWTRLQGDRDLASLALRIEALADPFDTFTGTAVGNGLAAAAAHLAAGPHCARTVIDISADGRANTGDPAGPVADALVAGGVDINALVLPASEMAVLAEGDPYLYYVNEVARSSASFVMEVARYEDYWMALKLKLLREMTPYIAGN